MGMFVTPRKTGDFFFAAGHPPSASGLASPRQFPNFAADAQSGMQTAFALQKQRPGGITTE
jgi:hypothetical protein